MADVMRMPATDEIRTRWGEFVWTADNEKQAKVVIGRYPPGRQHSADIPLLELAQRQVGAETGRQGGLQLPVIQYVARKRDMPLVRAYEVATFYTMRHLARVRRHHVQ